MKNQYFADITDYRNYGLLRILADGGALRTAVCWMLTPDDGRSDGGFTRYLSQPERFRRYDPPLFDLLAASLAPGEERSVRALARHGVIPGAVYFEQPLTDEPAEREAYFASFLRSAAGCDLVFFDPDNGMQVHSVPWGRRRSSKYLYWHELAAAYHAGFSTLVFQYYRREDRGHFTRCLVEEFTARLGCPVVFTFSTARVLFLLAAQAQHVQRLLERSRVVASAWRRQIQVAQHHLL